MISTPADAVVVWGNCQAGPVAELIRQPLAGHGLRVATSPAVHLITAPELERVNELVSRCAVLVTQPVSDNYHLAGCGSSVLIARLPQHATLVTMPVAFHVGPFPYQVRAHGGDGARVDAPHTDYHDLRAIVAAHRRLDVDEALRWWPAPTAAGVDAVRIASLRELERREAQLDVRVASLVDAPGALWTMTHPSNQVLTGMARAVLERLDVTGEPSAPSREYLAEKRAPVEASVADAYGWPPASVRTSWSVRGQTVAWRPLLTDQLRFYRARPDVVVDSLTRHADRLRMLGLRATD